MDICNIENNYQLCILYNNYYNFCLFEIFVENIFSCVFGILKIIFILINYKLSFFEYFIALVKYKNIICPKIF